AECWHRAAETVAGRKQMRPYADIGSYTVHHPIIRGGPLSVHTELSIVMVVVGCEHYPRGELDQSLETSAVHWQVFCQVPIHHCADRCRLGIHYRGSALDRHRLR